MSDMGNLFTQVADHVKTTILFLQCIQVELLICLRQKRRVIADKHSI